MPPQFESTQLTGPPQFVTIEWRDVPDHGLARLPLPFLDDYQVSCRLPTRRGGHWIAKGAAFVQKMKSSFQSDCFTSTSLA